MISQSDCEEQMYLAHKLLDEDPEYWAISEKWAEESRQQIEVENDIFNRD